VVYCLKTFLARAGGGLRSGNITRCFMTHRTIIQSVDGDGRTFITILEVVLFYTGGSKLRGPGSVVGIATGYGLDGPGIESRCSEIFRTCPDRPWGPPSLLYNGYRVFLGGKERPGRDPDPSPLLVPWS
jgi:hypothetical protein